MSNRAYSTCLDSGLIVTFSMRPRYSPFWFFTLEPTIRSATGLLEFEACGGSAFVAWLVSEEARGGTALAASLPSANVPQHAAKIAGKQKIFINLPLEELSGWQSTA